MAGAMIAAVTITVASINVNGIRAAVRRGMAEWLGEARPDVVAMQEVRAPEGHLPTVFADMFTDLDTEWSVVETTAEAKGRAGVAVAARSKLVDSTEPLGDRFRTAGRWVEATTESADGTELTVCSSYVHTGDANDADRMEEKLAFLDAIADRLDAYAAAGRCVLLTGDLNVAHDWRDIKNWKGNRGKAGFLPEEQARLDRIRDLGYVDLGRRFGGDNPGPYTWWSWRGKAFDNDAGWRIDYLIASPALAPAALGVDVHRAPTYAARWSDHAPVVATFDL